MQFEAKQLADVIVSEVQKGNASAPGGVVTAGANDFCAIWSQAKPILELIAGIAIIIPGVGSHAGAVLKGLIKVGDEISGQVCK